jgi:dTDP-4-dehydrorhamnose 3,5-epimerase-like enzyme
LPEFEHIDDRREFRQILTEDIKQINHYKARNGAILGNHYHIETGEYFFVLYGSLFIRWCKGSKFSSFVSTNIINEGDVLLIPPEHFHSVTCLKNTEFMTFLTVAHDTQNPDIWQTT